MFSTRQEPFSSRSPLSLPPPSITSPPSSSSPPRLQKYSGHFHHCLKEANGSAVDLLQLIVRTFPAYRDETFYHGQKGLSPLLSECSNRIEWNGISVSFYKRAQILIHDIWGHFHGHDYGHFQDLVRSFVRSFVRRRPCVCCVCRCRII